MLAAGCTIQDQTNTLVFLCQGIALPQLKARRGKPFYVAGPRTGRLGISLVYPPLRPEPSSAPLCHLKSL